MKTVVAILNWNGLDLLKAFLPGVVKTASPIAEIAVIDNCSSDGSVEWIRINFPSVTIVQNAINEGFAKGYNDGLRQLSADIFVLLNSDVEVTENWLKPLVEIMQKPAVVAAQPKIRSYFQREYFEYAGAAGGYIDRDGFIFCRGRMFDSYEKDNGQYDDDREIFWATGACLAVNAEAFRSVGGLDEDFFAHMEEIDLCWRLKNSGKKVMYCHHSIVFHQGGGTLSKINPQKTYLNFRNNLFLLLKNYRLGNVYSKLFGRMALDALAALKFLSQGQFLHFWAVARAHFDFYGKARRFVSKRKQLESTIAQPNVVGYFRKSVVWQYFVKNKRKFSELDPKDFT